MDKRLLNVEEEVLKQMVGKFSEIVDDDRRSEIIKAIAKKHNQEISHSDINTIIQDINDFAPIAISRCVCDSRAMLNS